MDLFGPFIILLLALMSIVRPVCATPDATDVSARIFEIDVSDIFCLIWLGIVMDVSHTKTFQCILVEHHVSLEN